MSARGGVGAHDLFLFNEGTHRHLWRALGAHPLTAPGERGARFAVWAPAAEMVSVVGDWNGWDPRACPLSPLGASGIWQGRAELAVRGSLYKYHVVSQGGRHRVDKSDPVGLFHEHAPRTASIVWDHAHAWGDEAWMKERGRRNALDAPMSIYEVHLPSWMRVPEEGLRPLTYRELGPRLAAYAVRMGYTHVELLPVMEHPFLGSWGYQVTGYFAPSSRYGTPQDFMALVDTLHQHGVGVILDWVPAHFPTDPHALARFDGTCLYEHEDPRRGFHPDWTTLIFNYGRHEVRSFLVSSAMVWLDAYHVDGLRVDGVASMLYLDYSRKEGEWVPNEHGGRENLEAVAFLRQLNEAVYAEHPDVQTIAEESTAWPRVSRPTTAGGLGFGLKWDLGWMHDTLAYLSREPVHRAHHHDQITFRSLYAFDENFVLPLSHDEVVHGKGSLLGKMPGDPWQRFANLRSLFGYQWAAPGKKLLFMGGDLAQPPEWSHDGSVEWHLESVPSHAGVQRLVAALNALYRERKALHELDAESGGFRWVTGDDRGQSVLVFERRGRSSDDVVLVVASFTPVPRRGYRVGVEVEGEWETLLDTDEARFGGSGAFGRPVRSTQDVPCHGRPRSLAIDLSPLAVAFLAPRRA